MSLIRGKIEYIELNDFKSYRGYHKIGPMKSFQAIIGPNGSGKSNLMDAISFVLGVRAKHLRGNRIADLAHRKARNEDGSEKPSKKAKLSRAYVKLTFLADSGERYYFQRIINDNTSSAASEYKVNNKTVSEEVYKNALEEISVLSNAKNFLVFQGDVTSVANKTGKELTKLFEVISGSAELEEEYQTALEAKKNTEEKTIHAYHKKKGVVAEKNEFKKMKQEADKYEEMKAKCDQIRLDRVLCTLRHLNKGIDKFRTSKIKLAEEINKAENERLAADKNLQEKRKQQASKHKAHIKQEHEVSKEQNTSDSLLHKYIAAREAEDHIKAHREVILKELERAKEEAASNEEVIKDLERQKNDLIKAQTNLEEEIKRAEKEFVTLTAEQQREYQAALAKVQQEISSEELELKPIRREKELCDDKLRSQSIKEAELLQKIASLEESKSKLDSRKDKIELFYEEVTKKLKDAKDAQKKKQDEYQDCKKQLESKLKN